MHELSIVRQFMDTAKLEVSRVQQPTKLLGLTVTVGRLSGASPEAIRFAFEILAPQSSMRGCTLNIVEPHARCICDTCNKVTEIDELVISCPACGASSIRIEGGRELRLEAIEVEDP